MVLLSGLASGLLRLVKPAMLRSVSGVRFAAHTISLAVLAVALVSESSRSALSGFISLPGPEADENQWIQFGTRIALLVVSLIVLSDWIKEMRRLLSIHRTATQPVVLEHGAA